MNFVVISSAPILENLKSEKLAYSPYVYEMDLWMKNVKKIKFVCPIKYKEKLLTSKFQLQDFDINKTPVISFHNIKESLISLFRIPFVVFQIFKGMFWSDHIHLRCPGNVGLLGCFVQIAFPSKPKTVKYAGNWDPRSKQPFSYKVQKWILSNTFLTKNCKVLVYGEWKNQSKNIIPFFTASYSENEITTIEPKNLKGKIKLLFVGNFSIGKQPLLTVKIAKILVSKGYDIQLDLFGDGARFNAVKDYILNNKLSNNVILHGNQPKEIVKKAFQKSHFLVFISKSEGWPKVVAEAMFWSCLPISSKVSCVPFMLGNGERGSIVNKSTTQIIIELEKYISQENIYLKKVTKAKDWSQQFTLEKFEKEIKNLL
ncbi:Poly(glycerol-phosphate) alpha-glucosyltransferase [Polaribacter huanghezhanensis]|uniref:glycosyltransferase n=1 Tax=Polaribacter huanghezhanensis TaxID=1354726 RepID=UPI00264719C7|nr:glycosyltransferase [Polaribacter huanghezhanensis]WKD86511.1 Poly(glycerol-phosphate) alpha-glucosyltransferase [Polaribacter huanghezhanensis]